MKLKAGDEIIPFNVEDIYCNPISTDNYRGQKLMIAFFRYAECLFCNLRVHQLMENVLEFDQKGLKVIAIFQSPLEDIKKNQAESNPLFTIIPDVKRELYKQYGIEYSMKGYLMGWLRWVKALQAFSRGHYVKRGVGSAKIIPADFLINPDGTIHTAFYGNDISEHLPLKKVREFLNS